MDNPKLWIGGGVVVGALVVVGIVKMLNQPSDQVLIHQAIVESIAASKEGRPGGVLEYVSSSFKVNDTDQFSPGQIANFVKTAKPDILIKDDEPIINSAEGTAVVKSPVTVKGNFLGNHQEFSIPEAKISLTREDARDWLIFPVKKWRISNVVVPQENIPGAEG